MPELLSTALARLPRPFSGAIFDCDGTLADTMPLHYQAWEHTISVHGGEFPERLFYELGGVPTPEIVRILNARYGISLDPERITHEKEARYAELLHLAQPIQPVVDLAHLLFQEFPLAVASGGQRPLVDRTLVGLGVTELFLAVCTTEDVERGKPEPDLFLLAAHRIGVAPESCVVFEDSDLGLEAARRAGMQGVDIRPWAPERNF